MFTVVFSTRSIDPDYIDHIGRTSGTHEIAIFPVSNDGKISLTTVYNRGMEVAETDIVVFCHDDLLFDTPAWGVKLLENFRNNPDMGIIGVAGTDALISGKWWEVEERMHGIVGRVDGDREWTVQYSAEQGDSISEMVALDGLFLAIHRKRIARRFDPEFIGFHFYDISFCFENHLAGVKVGLCTNIRVTHKSAGPVDEVWFSNKHLFEQKYAASLPRILKP